jgi:hypothetical protein
MDLLFFDAEPLFFDTPPAAEVVQLLQQAAENYGDEQAEADLQRAYHLAPDHLMVLVALFRYYVYQQRFLEALAINQHAREVELANRSGPRFYWKRLSKSTPRRAIIRSRIIHSNGFPKRIESILGATILINASGKL